MPTLRTSVPLLAGLLLVAACAEPPDEEPPPCEPDCAGRVCGVEPVCGETCGECEGDEVCIADGFTCRPPLPIGAACSEDLDCGANRVCIGQEEGAPGGYCTRSCLEAECPDEGVCRFTSVGEYLCHAMCAPNHGPPACRVSEGYVCTHEGFCPTCVPFCDSGAECGDDGCGGVCGMCNTASLICDDGRCRFGFEPLHSLGDRARWAAGSVEVQGRVWFVGGREGVFNANLFRPSRRSVKTDLYHPGDRTLQAMEDLPVALANPHAVAIGTALYVVGELRTEADREDGNEDPQFPSVDGAFYRYENRTWVHTGNVPEPSMGAGFASIDGKLHYYVGGLSDTVMGDRVHVFDPAEGWSRATERPTSRMGFATAQQGSRVWLAGGWDGTRALRVVESWSPETGWTRWTDLPVAVVGARAGIVDGQLVVFGGYASLRGDEMPVVQSIDLKTRRATYLGTTYNRLQGQAPALTRDGTLLLLGGGQFTATGSTANGPVVRFLPPGR